MPHFEFDIPEGYTVKVVSTWHAQPDQSDSEEPDVLINEQHWTVLDQKSFDARAEGARTEVIGRFNTEAEATAVLVGLEYAWPDDVNNGRFAIDGPAED